MGAAGWRRWRDENRVTRLVTPQAMLWVAAERRAAQLPYARCPRRGVVADEALAEILRGRLEGLGPVTQAALAAPLGLEPDDIGAALAALEVEGFALRGRFTPGSNAEEWCDRRLLARIHHYTVRRLRAEIEPVAARDFLRFLFAWQRVTDDDAPGRAGRGRRRGRAAGGLRGAGRRLGDRNPAGAHRRLRDRPGSTTCAWPGVSPGRD